MRRILAGSIAILLVGGATCGADEHKAKEEPIANSRMVVKYYRGPKGRWENDILVQKAKIPEGVCKEIVNQGLKFAIAMKANVSEFYFVEWFGGASGKVRFIQPSNGKVKTPFPDLKGLYEVEEFERILKEIHGK